MAVQGHILQAPTSYMPELLEETATGQVSSARRQKNDAGENKNGVPVRRMVVLI